MEGELLAQQLGVERDHLRPIAYAAGLGAGHRIGVGLLFRYRIVAGLVSSDACQVTVTTDVVSMQDHQAAREGSCCARTSTGSCCCFGLIGTSSRREPIAKNRIVPIRRSLAAINSPAIRSLLRR